MRSSTRVKTVDRIRYFFMTVAAVSFKASKYESSKVSAEDEVSRMAMSRGQVTRLFLAT